MTLQGTVQNGVVVFDDKQQFPDGTRVVVVVQNAPGEEPTLRERLAKLAGTVDDLPVDMARNHDHYIHGAPKK
jgi:glycine betaine/choline ABC-type transport system substrate-binding protein